MLTNLTCYVWLQHWGRFLSYPKYLSDLNCMGFVPLVEFAERFQPDAVELGNIEEALIRFHDMNRVLLELLRGAFTFLLKVDEVACSRGIIAREVVVVVEFLGLDAQGICSDETQHNHRLQALPPLDPRLVRHGRMNRWKLYSRKQCHQLQNREHRYMRSRNLMCPICVL